MNSVTERIVYDESVRALSYQDEVLSGLRTRAGTLLAAAALVTAFLAPAALEVRDMSTQGVVREFDGMAWSATGCFVAVVIASLIVLWPYRWLFSHSAHQLMDDLLDANPPADEATVLRHLAYYNDTHHETNGKKLGWLFVAFELGCLLLLAEISLWLIALAN